MFWIDQIYILRYIYYTSFFAAKYIAKLYISEKYIGNILRNVSKTYRVYAYIYIYIAFVYIVYIPRT